MGDAMLKPLSPEMKATLVYMQSNGGRLFRWPGGFWAKDEYQLRSNIYFGTSTIQALVRRDLDEYVGYKAHTRGCGEFPIEVVLKESA
jgi:hypothetical protein